MKAIIENSVKLWADPSTKIDQIEELNEIIDCIVSSPKEDFLRYKISKLFFKHFAIGFGSSHMWVKQVIRNEVKQQVLFVEF